MKTYWFEIDDKDSDLCGEEFFVELKDAQKSDAYRYACEIFPDVHLRLIAEVSQFEAEMMGLDTY